MKRAAVEPDQIDQVVLGHVLQAGCGQIPARQAAAKARIPLTVPALSVNKVCLAGLNAVAMADMMISSGLADVIVAGGMESMPQAPHLLRDSRHGIRYGDATMLDHVAYDALWDAFTDQSMGALTESCNPGDAAVARRDADALSARSHRLATSSSDTLAEEIVPVRVPQRHGDDHLISRDEGIRADCTAEVLAQLPPAFTPDGSITAGSSSQLSDGAAAMVIMSEDAAARYGCRPLARIGAYGTVAGPDTSLQLQPAHAIRVACRRQRLNSAELDLIEINEAFAAVVLASARDLGLTDTEIEERVNIHGGAIALGHPPGMSGARLVLHLAMELHRSGHGTAAATLCGGGGQGDALILTAA
ncbi:acetyl-CoA C-acetyltransferase [Actinopolymorpha pittospori]|uniref:Probable acetyl-CoA acetyltransferase n=2 Tax=Actinopolymorpha pittospori TaxID=648752 RepID=A0A927N4N6_9ACTN|nr:acetyl-CoA C-acetyltransferase [Actinopolymorpha pittospori]